jgi:hypothetical protein
MSYELPNFKCTEEAVRYGQTMTPMQYVLCEGAKQALQREFDKIRQDLEDYVDSEASGSRGNRANFVKQLSVDLATKIQLYREAQEVASDLVLSSVLSASSAVKS